MKKLSKILSMVMVVGLIAAIPASTQIMSGSKLAAATGSDLPMLILVNRLELSEDQMGALDNILTKIIGQKDELKGLTAEFEQAMIEFNGTGEELDAALAAFRENQLASAGALRESIAGALDEVRDLLSINQGLVLQEALPQLLGGALLGNDPGNGRHQDAASMMENRMPASSMSHGSRMGQQSPRGGQMPGQRGSHEENCSGECEDETLFGIPQGPFGERMDGQTREGMETMMAQRSGQNVDDAAMGEQMRGRLEQLGDRAPEQMVERFGAMMDERVDSHDAPGRRGLQRPEAASQSIQRERPAQNADVDLFGLLEQISDVLGLKLEAMK